MSETIKKYALIEFDEVKNNKKMVELVPINWLTNNETVCLWPPKNDEDKVEKWVKLEIGPYETWLEYPIKIISKARDYDQGLRRLKKAFKTIEVESTESESMMADQNPEPMLFSSTHVSQMLLQKRPLNIRNKDQCDTESNNGLNLLTEISEASVISSNNNVDAETNDEAVLDVTAEPKGITNYDDLAKYLQRIICTEMAKIKRSVNYTIGQQFKKILEVVQQLENSPSKQKAWNIIGDDLPYEYIEKFVAFDESLKENEEKRNALIEIFQMVSAGCKNYEDDVHKILEKMIKKEVQLEYSGCGRKIKGVGKKSFKETEIYKIMEKFLMAKYQTGKEKISVITAVSTFLSGAKDRDGGRAQRHTHTKSPLMEKMP